MTTIREQALAVVETRLNAIAGHKVFRNPSRALAIEDLPALAILAKRLPEADRLTGVDVNRFDFTVEVTADGASQANASYGLVIEALTPEPPLGGLVQDLVEISAGVPALLTEQGFGSAVALSVKFTVQYLTAEAQPEVAA